jgi:hypothetical protein
MSIRALIAAVALLALPASASAGTSVLVAWGGGKTQCNITVKKSQPLIVIWGSTNVYDVTGTTDCSANVEQTGQASLPGSPTEFGNLCSGLRMTCSSSAHGEGFYTAPAEYHVTLTAPPAQIWLGSPTECTGVNTDRLDCTFTSQSYFRVIGT